MKRKKEEYRPWENPVNLTPEEIEFNKRKWDLYDYYGIPYGVIDDSKTEESTKDLDYLKASILISQGEEISKDLEERLFKYKEDSKD